MREDRLVEVRVEILETAEASKCGTRSDFPREVWEAILQSWEGMASVRVEALG